MGKKNNRLPGLLLALLICLGGACYCGFQFYQEWQPGVVAEAVYESARERAFELPDGGWAKTDDGIRGKERTTPDFTALQEWNPDVRGWIYGVGTDIDYPVVQGEDNDYYLNHTADRVSSVIGAIFMESQNAGDFSDDVTVLYGHHIRGGRMFSSLTGYRQQSYYDSHPELRLDTPEGSYRIELFAGQILDGATGQIPLGFSAESTREAWLLQLRQASTFRSPVIPMSGERILVLCTCTYDYQDARYVVYGVIRQMEETET